MRAAGDGPDRKLLRQVFAGTVVELRRESGMAQEMLALKSGIDRGYMGGLERARHMPTIHTLYRLLPVFRISFVQFAERFEANLRKARRDLERNG